MDSQRLLKLVFMKPWQWLLTLLVVVVICFSPGLTGPFFSDDYTYIINNPAYKNGSFWTIFSDSSQFEFLPLRDLSLYIDYQLFGLNPLGYKLHNLLLYLLLGIAVWMTTWRLLSLWNNQQAGKRNVMLPTVLVTALFMLHPAHVESVNWISGRKDLLCSLFAFISLWQYSKAMGRWQKGKTAGRYILLSSLSLAAALLSKSAALPMVGFMWLLGVIFLRAESVKELLRITWLISPLILITLLFIFQHIGFGYSSGVALAESSVGDGVSESVAVRALSILGGLTEISLWPVDLRLQYSIYNNGAVDGLKVSLALMVIGGTLWGIWASLKRHSLLGAALVFFTIMLVPYLQLIPFQSWSLISERFLLFTIYGAALALTLCVMQISKPVIKIFLILIVLLALALSSLLRSADWQSETVLFDKNWQAQPEHFYNASLKLIYNDIANQQWQEAHQVVDGVTDVAFKALLSDYLAFYQALLTQNGERGIVQAAEILSKLHLVHKALETSLKTMEEYNFHRIFMTHLATAYQRLAERMPSNPYIHYNIGLLKVQNSGMRGDTSAIAAFQKAISLGLSGTTLAQAWNYIGMIYATEDDWQKAEQAFNKAFAIDPNDYISAYHLIYVYQRLNQPALLDKVKQAFIHRAKKQGKRDDWISDQLSEI